VGVGGGGWGGGWGWGGWGGHAAISSRDAATGGISVVAGGFVGG
jgi:hypothetical protein